MHGIGVTGLVIAFTYSRSAISAWETWSIREAGSRVLDYDNETIGWFGLLFEYLCKSWNCIELDGCCEDAICNSAHLFDSHMNLIL